MPVVAKGIIAIGQFGCGVVTIAQFGIGLVAAGQFALAGGNGGRDGIRTHDPGVANAVLSQLSYSPTLTLSI